jgi:hypothetical protein
VGGVASVTTLQLDASVPEELILRAIRWSGQSFNLKKDPESNNWSLESNTRLDQREMDTFLQCLAEFRLRQALDTRTAGVRQQIVEDALAEVYKKR